MRRYCNQLELSEEEMERIKKRYKECKGRRIAERLLCLLMKTPRAIGLMKKKVMRNQFYKTFEEFIGAVNHFFTHLDDYAGELASLMRDKFQIIECV